MATAPEIIAAAAVEVIIFGIAGGLVYRFWKGAAFLPQRKTLLPFNQGVVLEGDRLVKVLQSGRHWVWQRYTIIAVDTRPRPFQMSSRELLTLDKQGVRIRLSGEYKVLHPATFVRESSDGHAALYLSLERETARSIAELDRAEILEGRVSPSDRIRERMEPRAAQLGIELTHLEVCDLVPIAWVQQFDQN